MTPHSLGRINFSAVLASLLLLAMQLTSFAQTPTTRAWDDPSAVKGVAEGKDPDITDNFILYRYDTEPYRLDPGPHLFIDYRYILPGRTGYIFPDGTEAPRYDGDAERLPGIIGVPSGAPSNIRIEAQEAQKLGIVLENDQPWEYCLGYHTLLHFDGKYRLWYDTVPPRNSKIGDRGLLCYAESEDGLKWVKPKVGIVDFEGSKDNNIVYGEPVAKHSFHGSSVFVDPIAAPAERLKLIYMSTTNAEELAKFKAAHPASVSPIGEQKMLFIRLAHSADGIHWTPRPQPLMSHMSDTQTTVYYDEHLKRYVGFFRLAYMNRRAIGRTEGKGFEPWPVPKIALFPEPIHDRPGDDYYISGYSRYPGTRTMHLMIPTVYKRHTDSTDLAMAASMDGEHWTWLPGGPVVEPGVDGSWDGGCIFGGIGLTELPDGRVVSPYVGYTYPHKFPRYERHMGRIGLAAWGKERLAAAVAEEEGEFVTGPLSSIGTQLFLNFQTQRNGYVKVAIEGGPSGRSLEECDVLFGDQAKKLVTWKGDGGIGVKPGYDFTLHFKLRAAKLFSFELRPADGTAAAKR